MMSNEHWLLNTLIVKKPLCSYKKQSQMGKNSKKVKYKAFFYSHSFTMHCENLLSVYLYLLISFKS